MPVEPTVLFLTSFWKPKTEQLYRILKSLDRDCPPDEICEIRVGERQEDSWIHVTIFRTRRTALMSDGWSIALGEKPNTYKYEKAFRNEKPSLEDIAESIRRTLKAPECNGSGSSPLIFSE